MANIIRLDRFSDRMGSTIRQALSLVGTGCTILLDPSQEEMVAIIARASSWGETVNTIPQGSFLAVMDDIILRVTFSAGMEAITHLDHFWDATVNIIPGVLSLEEMAVITQPGHFLVEMVCITQRDRFQVVTASTTPGDRLSVSTGDMKSPKDS